MKDPLQGTNLPSCQTPFEKNTIAPVKQPRFFYFQGGVSGLRVHKRLSVGHHTLGTEYKGVLPT